MNQPIDQKNSATSPEIDVVIAVHTATRPRQRAVESCAVHKRGPRVRVTVVCHNISIQEILHNFVIVDGVDVRFLELHDGLNSPAGPKNAGLDAATAPYLCLLDSDDYLEPAALEHWYRVLESAQADVVIAPVRHESGKIIKTPRARPRRVANLDPVRDGLAYATAMRGLWRADAGGTKRFRYVPELRVGEDLSPGLQIYFSGARFYYPRKGPAYVLGNEAVDRVTGSELLLAEEFRAILQIPSVWLDSLSLRQRQSIAVKIARTSLVAAIVRRGAEHDWNNAELAAVKELTEFLDGMAPTYDRALTVRDSKLLAESLKPQITSELMSKAIETYGVAGLPATVFTVRLWDNLGRGSQLRQLVRATLDFRS